MLSTNNQIIVLQRIYRYIFWIGYLLVLVTAFIPLAGSLDNIKLGQDAFQIRLDHLLHFTAYFMICLYYLAGQAKGLSLFTENSLKKFVLLILLLATTTELVQLLVPNRAFNLFDMAANVLGMIVGVFITITLSRKSELGTQRSKKT